MIAVILEKFRWSSDTPELNVSKLTNVVLSAKTLAIYLTVLSSILHLRRLWNNLACETLPKASVSS